MKHAFHLIKLLIIFSKNELRAQNKKIEKSKILRYLVFYNRREKKQEIFIFEKIKPEIFFFLLRKIRHLNNEAIMKIVSENFLSTYQ